MPFSQRKKEPQQLVLLRFNLAPPVRFELTTLRLTAGCSTAELRRNISEPDFFKSGPSFCTRQRPTFPARLQASIIGAKELNFCVRNGNRWVLFAIATGLAECLSSTHSQLHIFQLYVSFLDQALDLLVSIS